jgi:excisionase family DNA binding protein
MRSEMTKTTELSNFAINRPLSREELADLLGMSLRTIERYDQQGRIRTILIGNKKRVPPSEVARIIEEGI